MRSKTYQRAIEWIVKNDKGLPLKLVPVMTSPNVRHVAHIYQMSPQDVALDVLRLRTKNENFEWKVY